MDVIMSGLTFEVCLTYLDDVIVFSADLETQFARLRLVLERLQRAGEELEVQFVAEIRLFLGTCGLGRYD